MIAIRGLVKRYREFTAVAGIDLHVAPGELYVCLGPNGAGKTTTIKCLAGLLRPSAGSVTVGGHDVHGAPQAAKRLIGYIPDRPFLYEKLTGSELIRFMAELYGSDLAAVASAAEALLERLDLKGWEGELIESYSYGMRQKIVLTAVLARDHQALVIDEPMVGLDPRAAKTLRELLLAEAAAGKALLVSTHSIVLAEQIASRIGIIHRGRLVAEGTMAELRSLARRPPGADGDADLENVFLALTAEAAAGVSAEPGGELAAGKP